MSRKPATRPATAYDYRRAIYLVQMISNNAHIYYLKAPAGTWGVATFSNDTRDDLLQRMAEHALEYAIKQADKS